ncbi:MAG: exopolygalacturonase [Bacteroidaceae bacterium]|nr:exopolygalacturonase [Bacteroidaceae bacterium]
MKLKHLFFLGLVALTSVRTMAADDKFPDGTVIPEWFRNISVPTLAEQGKAYVITDYGVVNDSTILQTEKIQAVIDRAAQEGGGVIVVPEGTFLSGSLFFRQGTNLHLKKGATIKGSDDISNFPILKTRMEGQTLDYFAALINVDNVNGFKLTGEGTLDGNGLRYWKSFWLRRKVNPKCTNMEELRPRLVYVSNSNEVLIAGVKLKNSPFWTTHLYRSNYVKLLGLTITSPASPVKAPSTDAVDVDVCNNVLIKNCYMAVNDDAVALKGGKGPWADKDENNGENTNIIIEDCNYGFCHGALTCGSESIHDKNIIVRRCKIDKASRLLWLKMRPDTPQMYEYITVEDITGDVDNVLVVRPWTQFFDLKGRKDTPMSYSQNIIMRNINVNCKVVFNLEKADDQYKLKDFLFEKFNVTTKNGDLDKSIIENLTLKKVVVNGDKLK